MKVPKSSNLTMIGGCCSHITFAQKGQPPLPPFQLQCVVNKLLDPPRSANVICTVHSRWDRGPVINPYAALQHRQSYLYYVLVLDLEADPTVGKCNVLQAYFVLLRSVATCSNCTLSYRQKMHNLESKGRVCKIVYPAPMSLYKFAAAHRTYTDRKIYFARIFKLHNHSDLHMVTF